MILLEHTFSSDNYDDISDKMKIRFYRSLYDIGLSAATTIPNIVSSMDSNSVFMSTEVSLIQSELPPVTWGILIIIKANRDRVTALFFNTVYSTNISFNMYGKPITYNNGYITGNWITIASKIG